MVTKEDKNNFKLGREMSISQSISDISKKQQEKKYSSIVRPSKEDIENGNKQRNLGIEFYESGNRIEDLSDEELKKLGYFFKVGYEIAKRKEYGRILSEEIKKGKTR